MGCLSTHNDVVILGVGHQLMFELGSSSQFHKLSETGTVW